MTIDGVALTEGQRLSWHADDEHEQTPRIRATFDSDWPFCITTPSGEPIRSYRLYKHAALAVDLLMSEEY